MIVVTPGYVTYHISVKPDAICFQKLIKQLRSSMPVKVKAISFCQTHLLLIFLEKIAEHCTLLKIVHVTFVVSILLKTGQMTAKPLTFTEYHLF